MKETTMTEENGRVISHGAATASRRKKASSSKAKSLLDAQPTSELVVADAPGAILDTTDGGPPSRVQVRRNGSSKLSTPSEMTHTIDPSCSNNNKPSDASHTEASTYSSIAVEDSRHPSPSRASARSSHSRTKTNKPGGVGSISSTGSHSDESLTSRGATASVAASKKTAVTAKTAATSKMSKTTATTCTTITDIKLSSERLEVLVTQLRETLDEKEAATIILEFALRIKNHELVVNGADVSIINTMKRFSNSTKIQTRGCKALAEMASKGLSNIESIVDKGGSDIILKAMEKHRAEEDLQKEACRAIECITRGTNLGKESFGLHSKDAIAFLLHCMGDHPGSAKLQRLACRALATIADCHAECSQCIVNKGGLEAIRKTLRHHDDNTEVIETAFDILIRIASSVGKCSLDEEIAMTISMDRVLATMLLFRKNEKMQSQGMALLCILCKVSPRNRAKIASLYALEVVTKSLENCILNKEVQRHGTTLITNLCQTEGNAVAASLMSEGGMELLLNVMRRHGSDPVIVQQIFLIIAKMARPFSDKIRKEGGIELIMSGMRRHEENVQVQEAACMALWKLSHKTENANVINGNGGVSLINAALARFPNDSHISEVACEALASLSHDKQIMIAQQTLRARAAASAAAAPKPETSSSCWGCGVSCF